MDDRDKADYARLQELSEEANKAYSGWLKHVLTMASGLVAILIALHSSKSGSALEHWLFGTTIAAFAGGILFGCIALYTEVQSPNSLAKALLQHRRERRAGDHAKAIVVSDPPKIYGLAQRICYFLLAAGLISLVAYAITLDAPSQSNNSLPANAQATMSIETIHILQ